MNEEPVGQLTIVGLGLGAWDTLTMGAIDALRQARIVYVRTALHPPLAAIQAHLPEIQFHSFDHLYETLPHLSAVYDEIVRRVIEAAVREPVVYAVPGSPSLSESTVRMLRGRARTAGIPVQLVQGLSYVEPVLAAVGISDAPWVQVLEAAEVALMADENALGEVPGEAVPLPWRAPIVTVPTLISYLYDCSLASAVKLWLGKYYPDEHRVQVVHTPGTSECRVEAIPLYELDRLPDIDYATALYVPPLAETENTRTFAGLMNVTRALRAPGGCPWDREQTHASLKPHLLEEAYEVMEALDSGDTQDLAEELGDLLFQVTIHSQVAAEAGEFSIEEVIGGIAGKLIGRHPHVFGELRLETADEVRGAWEGFKQREKPKRASILEQIPKGLPALPQSNLIQKRASSVGFEWPSLEEVISKVEEEIAELRHEVQLEASKDDEREEFGDILFALVSVARHLHIDPEEALRLANRKFVARFQYVEARVNTLDKSLRDLSPQELDTFWQEAKALGTHRVSQAGA